MIDDRCLVRPMLVSRPEGKYWMTRTHDREVLPAPANQISNSFYIGYGNFNVHKEEWALTHAVQP